MHKHRFGEQFGLLKWTDYSVITMGLCEKAESFLFYMLLITKDCKLRCCQNVSAYFNYLTDIRYVTFNLCLKLIIISTFIMYVQFI